MGALYSISGTHMNYPIMRRKEKRKSGSSVHNMKKYDHVTQGEEKKWELCTAFRVRTLTNPIMRSEEEKRWELCTYI